MPPGARPFTDTLSVVKDPAVTVDGVMDTELRASPPLVLAVTVTIADRLLPLYVAITTAVAVAVIVLDCTEMLVVLWPAGTVTLDGTGSAMLFEERLIVAPPDGACALSVTDRVALAPPATGLGLIEKPVSVGRLGVVGVTVTLAVWVPPLYVAVTVVIVIEVISVLDCTEKLVVLWPAGIE